MRIRYGSSLWSKEKGLCGLPQRTDWQFEYAGVKRFIPAIYRFPKGIVFDILTILDETKLHGFYEKYENNGEELTPLQRWRAELEHPCQDVSIKEIWINQKPVEGGYSSSCAVIIPWQQQENELSQVQKAYQSILKGMTCFACQRYCVPYPETHSKITKMKRFLRLDRVNSIRFSTRPVQRLFPLDIGFEMSEQDHAKEVCFKHPATGVDHTLYFQTAKSVKIPLDETGNQSFFMTRSMYEIDPALPEGDSLRFGTSTQYTTEPPEGSLMPTAASSIGIIGGADGPTAIFISGPGGNRDIPRGLHGLPLHGCSSVPSLKGNKPAHFLLDGIRIKQYDSMEYHLGDFDCAHQS